MKKIKIILMIVLSMAIVTGCGAKSPTEVVNHYFSEMKKGENADLANYLLENVELQNKDRIIYCTFRRREVYYMSTDKAVAEQRLKELEGDRSDETNN